MVVAEKDAVALLQRQTDSMPAKAIEKWPCWSIFQILRSNPSYGAPHIMKVLKDDKTILCNTKMSNSGKRGV